MVAAGLAILFGGIVGMSLGLTGGGGSILAVPMLVFGVGISVHEALPVSLMSVGATALFGAIERLRRREVEIVTGLIFAGGGVSGGWVGALLADRIRPDYLLLMFSALMLYVALRMWMRASRQAPVPPPAASEPHARRSRRTTGVRYVIMTVVLGLITGVLSGLFGVGGGFLIVPALVLVSGMPIHRAVATSLLVIPLVSISGIVGHLSQRDVHAIDVAILFVIGGVAGMWIGTSISRRLSAAMLQKTFAAVIVGVAVFNVVMTMLNPKFRESGSERPSEREIPVTGGQAHVLPSTLHPRTGDRIVRRG